MGSLFDVENTTISRLRREALGTKENKIPVSGDTNNIISGLKPELHEDYTEQNLANLNLEELDVHKLRHLARSIERFPIQGRQISKANRQQLMEYFKKLS